ncbi:MAG: hypothetical protein M3493_10830 [Actinomycetota bacterium]|nr:hypothetical protein [Actinomycetota bacterium]
MLFWSRCWSSSVPGQAGWLPSSMGVLSAELGWAAAYVAVGEQQPLIWLVPAVGALLAGVVLVRVRLASAPAASPSRW